MFTARPPGLVTLDLRRVEPGDARLLFDWANDPVVRAQSFSSEPIEWTSHVQWLTRCLAAPDRYVMFIAGKAGEPVGLTRAERDGQTVVLSYSLDVRWRGRGLAAPLVREGLARLVAWWPGTRYVEAHVKPDNEPSRRALTKAGFRLDCSEPERHVFVWVPDPHREGP